MCQAVYVLKTGGISCCDCHTAYMWKADQASQVLCWQSRHTVDVLAGYSISTICGRASLSLPSTASFSTAEHARAPSAFSDIARQASPSVYVLVQPNACRPDRTVAGVPRLQRNATSLAEGGVGRFGLKCRCLHQPSWKSGHL